ncbi:MAG: GNAT family N-acetyltransferase [bacterium]
MTVTIRSAVPEDAPELAKMRYEFRTSLNHATESLEVFVERTAPWMAARLQASSNWRCWLAVGDDHIAGHLWLQLIEKIPNPAPELEQHAYITNVYVSPDARSEGLGARLMEMALAFCRESRVDSVILWPTDKSRTLYARHGFALPEDMMEAVLEPARDVH